ncbi:FkbM family methyltransferase [Halostagnicola bangensis]
MSEGSIRRRGYQQLRRLVLGGYYRLVRANYAREAIAPQKRTAAGTIRSYELYNRHGNDEMLAELDSRCGPDDVIYDIGANVGTYSLALLAAEPNRHVVAFEPAPSAAEHLLSNAELNGLEDRLEFSPVGLGEERGSETFYVSTYTELSGFDRESAERWEASVAEVLQVPVERLDAMVEAGPAPDVLKIDVEGTAPAVLKGGRSTLETQHPLVFLECHEEGLEGNAPAECREILADHGYTIDERETYWVCEPPTDGSRSS